MTGIALILLGSVLGALATKFTELLVDAYRQRRRDRAKLVLVNQQEVLTWGWSGSALLRRLIALDRKVLGSALTDEREGTVQQWGPIFVQHPETWTLLCTGAHEIVGYWHFAPLRNDQFARAKAGRLLDAEVTLDTVDHLDVPGRYNLYFVLLGMLPAYRGRGATLIDAFFARLEDLAERGVLFRELCANAFTKDGRRLCEGFGMQYRGPHQDFGAVYSLSLHPWPPHLRHKRWENLARLYESPASVEARA